MWGPKTVLRPQAVLRTGAAGPEKGHTVSSGPKCQGGGGGKGSCLPLRPSSRRRLPLWDPTMPPAKCSCILLDVL